MRVAGHSRYAGTSGYLMISVHTIARARHGHRHAVRVGERHHQYDRITDGAVRRLSNTHSTPDEGPRSTNVSFENIAPDSSEGGRPAPSGDNVSMLCVTVENKIYMHRYPHLIVIWWTIINCWAWADDGS